MVIKKIKRIKAKITKRQKYDERNSQFVQNKLFLNNQKLLFKQIERQNRQNDVKINAEESRKCWSDIWSQNVGRKANHIKSFVHSHFIC